MATDKNKIEVEILAVDNTGKAIQSVAKGFGGLGKTILTGAGIAATAVAGIGAAFGKLAIDAAPVADVQAAFRAYTAASGQYSGAVLQDLQAQSAGLITNADLMTSYNKATQLVGAQFANQLPAAMAPLGKVAAATGQDMGYLMDSLVTGVGRLSPMILDNLGIQVDLTQANEDYAASIGKSVSELTKQEQQAALMAQVTQKLAENTEALPDVANTAAAMWGRFNVSMQNAKDTLGLALLPLFTPIIEKVSELSGYLSPLINYFKAVVDDGDTLNDFLADMPESWRAIIVPIGELIQKFDHLKSETGSVGGALLAMIPPEFRTAWEELSAWFSTNIAPIFSTIADQVGEAGGRMADLWNTHKDSIIAGAQLLIQIVGATFIGGFAFIMGLVNGFLALLQGDFSGAWDAITTGVETLANGILSIMGTNLEEVRTVWADNFKRLPDVINAYKHLVIQAGKDFIQGFIDGIKSMATNIASTMADIVGNALQAAKDALGIKSPSREAKGIALNFSNTFMDTLDGQARKVAATMGGLIGGGVNAAGSATGAPVLAGAGGLGGGNSITININGAQDSRAIMAELERKLKLNGVRL